MTRPPDTNSGNRSSSLPRWAYIVIGVPLVCLWLLMACASTVIVAEVLYKIGAAK